MTNDAPIADVVVAESSLHTREALIGDGSVADSSPQRAGSAHASHTGDAPPYERDFPADGLDAPADGPVFPTAERGFSADEDMVDGDMVVGVDDTSGFPAAGGVDGARFAPPAEIEIVPLSRVDDITGEDRRNDLDSLPEVPDLGTLVGLVDASTDASTQAANVIVDEKIELDLDTFVVSAQRLTDGSVLFHYGLVTEVSGRVEGAEMATDTARRGGYGS